MIDLHFGYNQESGGLKHRIPQRTKEHSLLVSDMLDDIRSDPSGYRKREVDEQDGSLTKILVSVVIVQLRDHVLQRVEGCEHDHKTYAQVTDPEVLLGFSKPVLL